MSCSIQDQSPGWAKPGLATPAWLLDFWRLPAIDLAWVAVIPGKTPQARAWALAAETKRPLRASWQSKTAGAMGLETVGSTCRHVSAARRCHGQLGSQMLSTLRVLALIASYPLSLRIDS